MEEHLRQTVERLHRSFRECPDPDRRERPEGWSVRQLLGHLVDSAGNNHQRLARYAPGGELRFPAYDQQQFLARARYESFDYQELVALWYGFNRLLLHLIGGIPAADRESSRIALDGERVLTVGELIAAYLTHLETHERQLGRIMGEADAAGRAAGRYRGLADHPQWVCWRLIAWVNSLSSESTANSP